MALIVIYILTSSFVLLLDFIPLRIAGIFLGICYIPGLCFFSIGKREKLNFEDLLLAFPCSVGISSLLILGLLYLGVHVEYIFTIIHIITGITVLIYIVTRNENKPYTAVMISNRELTFCSIALLITFMLGITLIFGTERIDISYHGFFHSSLVTQILNGIFPPENPGMGGTDVSYAWGFHAFIAALSAQMNLHPLKINSLLNLISLFVIICIAYRSAKYFGLSEIYCYLVPLAVIGLTRADAGVFFLAKLLTGYLPSLDSLPPYPWIVKESFTWTMKFPFSWTDPRLYFLHKFYVSNAMPLGISLSLASLFIPLLLIDKNSFDRYNKKSYLISIGIVIIACIFIYPLLAIIPLLFIPTWAGFIFLSNHGSFKEKFRGASEILFPYIIGVLIALPYMLFVISNPIGSRNLELNPADVQIMGLDFYFQSITNLMTFWLTLPLIIIGIWIVIKRLAYSKELFFLLIGTLLCLGLFVFMRLPFDNSYKFAYIISFFFAILFVFALSSVLPLLRFQWLKGFVLAGVILFLLATPVLTETSYILSSWFRDTTYTFSGNHIVFTKDNPKNKAYRWIRENTSPRALIMLTYAGTSHEDCDAGEDSDIGSIYMPAALSERNLFVLEDPRFTTRRPEYAKRASIREQLFKEPGNPQVAEFFTSMNSPIYLLVDEDSHPLSTKTKKWFSQVFYNDNIKIYQMTSY